MDRIYKIDFLVETCKNKVTKLKKGELSMKKVIIVGMAAVLGMASFGLEATREGLSLTGSKASNAKAAAKAEAREAAVSTKDLLEGLKPDTVFLKVGDAEGDEVTWGALQKQVDGTMGSSLGALLEPADDPMNDMRLGFYAKGVSRLLRKYLGVTLIKQEAQRVGITISAEEFATEEENIRKRGRDSGPFPYQYMTNAIYQRAYAEKYLKPSIAIPEERIDALIKARHELNVSVPLTNEIFRTQLEELRGRLMRNEISWGEAAEEFSECTECCSEDGDCGSWEEDEDPEDRDPNLLKTAFSMPTNTVSEIVETPDAFHIVKILSRYEPTAKAREEDGEVSSVEVRHIQLDKWLVEPEYTKESAREILEGREITNLLKRKQLELMKTTKIECVIPLFRDKDSKEKGPIIEPRR